MKFIDNPPVVVPNEKVSDFVCKENVIILCPTRNADSRREFFEERNGQRFGISEESMHLERGHPAALASRRGAAMTVLQDVVTPETQLSGAEVFPEIVMDFEGLKAAKRW